MRRKKGEDEKGGGEEEEGEDKRGGGQRKYLTGIPASCGLSSKLWSSFLEASSFSWSAESTM